MAGINFSSMDMNNIPSPTGSNMILSFHSNGHLSKKDSNGNITDLESAGSINKIFYVSKQYSGTASSVITGITGSTYISSSNSSYNFQLSSAVMGAISKPFPDPWSARNAAINLIASNSIDRATIIVIGGEWSVGSDNSSYNGDPTGLYPNSGVSVDICFSSTNGNNGVSSLFQNNIDYVFYPNTYITYLNSSYSIYLGYNSDPTNSIFNSNIYGKGNFSQVYGLVNGFNANFIYLNNGGSTIRFESEYCIFQQSEVFKIINYYNAYINIDELICSDTTLFGIYDNSYSPITATTSNSQIDINVNNLKWGLGWIPYPETNSHLHLLNLGFSTNRYKAINVNINSLVGHMSPESLLYFDNSTTIYNNIQLDLSIGNFIQSSSTNGYHTASALIQNSNFGNLIGTSSNFEMLVNIDSAFTDVPLLNTTFPIALSGSSNNVVTYNIKSHYMGYTPSNIINSNILVGSSNYSNTTGSPVLVNVNGNFYNQNVNGMIISTFSSATFSGVKNIFSGTYLSGTNSSYLGTYSYSSAYVVDLSLLPDKSVVFKNASIAGSSTYSVRSSNTRNVYFQNVHASTLIDPNISQIGSSASISSDLVNYI